LSGALGGEFTNDVVAPNSWRIEVKRRASAFKTIYDWVLDTRESPDAVAFRADRMPWLVVMTVEKFNELLDAARYADELHREREQSKRSKEA
jgi:hypothetical protein